MWIAIAAVELASKFAERRATYARDTTVVIGACRDCGAVLVTTVGRCGRHVASSARHRPEHLGFRSSRERLLVAAVSYETGKGSHSGPRGQRSIWEVELQAQAVTAVNRLEL